MIRRIALRLCFGVAVVSFTACSWQEPPASVPDEPKSLVKQQHPRPVEPPRDTTHVRAARIAASQAGTPYLFGGNSPRGFDCSGLVWFAYQQVGQSTPRTTRSLWHSLPRVASEQKRAGDVLFFSIEGKPSHVGLYLGDGNFVHAPSSGKHVSIMSLDKPYYRDRLIAIGRP